MANDVKRVLFNSASASISFSATQTRVDFSSASRSVTMIDAGPLQRILQEDGFAIRTEAGFNLLKENQ